MRDTARGYCRGQADAARARRPTAHERFDREIMNELGAARLARRDRSTAMAAPAPATSAYGLVAREVERVDSGYRSAMSVQSSLVDASDPCLWHRGAAPEVPAAARHRRDRRLLRPDRARPRLRSRQHDDPRRGKAAGGYRLNGAKMWITNAPIADVFVVWAKDDAGAHPRLHPRARHERPADAEDRRQVLACAPRSPARSSWTTSFVPEENLLPNVAGPEGPVRLPQQRALRHRLGRAWAPRSSAGTRRATIRLDRKQFGRPLAANQLIQKKLADMQTEIALGLQACLRARPALTDEGRARPEMISLLEAQQLRQGARHRPRSPATCTAATASPTSSTSSAM